MIDNSYDQSVGNPSQRAIGRRRWQQHQSSTHEIRNTVTVPYLISSGLPCAYMSISLASRRQGASLCSAVLWVAFGLRRCGDQRWAEGAPRFAASSKNE